MNLDPVSTSQQIRELPPLDVRQRLDELRLLQPTGVAFLPQNLAQATMVSELYHCDSVMPLRKLLKAEGLSETPIEPDGLRLPRMALRSIDWVGPTIFVSASLIVEDPNMLSVCLNVISNYVYDLFKGRTKEVTAKLRIAIEPQMGQPAKMLEYEGDVEGLTQLPKIIKSLNES